MGRAHPAGFPFPSAGLQRPDDAERGEIDGQHEGEAEPQEPAVRIEERGQQWQARVGGELRQAAHQVLQVGLGDDEQGRAEIAP